MKLVASKSAPIDFNDMPLSTLIESDPFYYYESKTIVSHLTKLNDIATMFTNDEKTRYYFILKLFQGKNC